MNRLTLMLIAVFGILSSSALAQNESRELGPHVHGAGTLTIAVDGNTIAMDFSAPANDIIGFEHAPSTPEQQQILAQAKEKLAHPLDLFALPAAAGCTLASANVVFNAAEPATADKPKAADPAAPQHADFDVDYALACKDATMVTSIAFPYFKAFPNSQKLSVTIASDKGQSQYDVTRDTPQLTVK